jgi:plasmid stabilization system protein ParE
VAKLVWTEEALRWLEDIFEYIAQDNPHAAAQTVQGIYDRAQSLIEFPPRRLHVSSAQTGGCKLEVTICDFKMGRPQRAFLA